MIETIAVTKPVMWGISWLTYGKFTLICSVLFIICLYLNFKLAVCLDGKFSNWADHIGLMAVLVVGEVLFGLLIYAAIIPYIRYIIINW